MYLLLLTPPHRAYDSPILPLKFYHWIFTFFVSMLLFDPSMQHGDIGLPCMQLPLLFSGSCALATPIVSSPHHITRVKSPYRHRFQKPSFTTKRVVAKLNLSPPVDNVRCCHEDVRAPHEHDVGS